MNQHTLKYRSAAIMILNLILHLLAIFIGLAQSTVITYPRPSIYQKSAHFSLSVNGTDIYTVSYAGYDYAQLTMTEGQETEFKITVTDASSISAYRISPAKVPIAATISGNQLTFSAKNAYYLIVKIDEEKEFVILADPPETDAPNPTASNVINVLNHGADNTGSGITTGIQDSLHVAASAPGSIVYVPEGLYVIGNLIIPNNTSLYLAGGSVLRFTANKADYTTHFTKSGLGDGTWWIRTAFNTDNIKVYGRGTIDGNGAVSQKGGFIADLLVPVGTTNFRADGPLIRDGSFWAVTPIQCTGAYLVNLKILNRHDVGQDDAVDVCESERVTVRRSIGISLDDSFSAKTWPYKRGTTVPYPYEPRPNKDILFDNCLAWTDCYGYKLGQGAYEDMTNITFQNSVVYTAAVGLGIDHREGSATIDGVTFSNMDIESLHGSNLGHATWLAIFIEQPETDGAGPVKNLVVHSSRARKLGTGNAMLQGYSDSAKVSGVTLQKIYLYANSTPASTLVEMKILDTAYSENIVIDNS